MKMTVVEFVMFLGTVTAIMGGYCLLGYVLAKVKTRRR